MNPPLHVLLVEDSEDDALLLGLELQRGGYELDMVRVETAADMQAALERQTWDVVIADYNLPRFSALAALKIVQASGLDLPLIVISGAVGEEVAVDAMRAGAQDFILKGYLGRLLPALQRELQDAQERRLRRDAEARYRDLFTQMQAGFALHEILLDDDGRPHDYRFLETNPAFERITGLTATGVVGKTVREVLPAIAPSWIEHYGEVALTGQSTLFEQYEPELGKYFQISAFRPRPGHFATVIADVTPLREAEAAHRAEEERFRRLLEHSSDIVAVVDQTGLILYASPAIERVLGLPLSRTIGADVFQRVHPDDQTHVAAVFAEGLRQPGQAQHLVCRYRHADDSWVVLEVISRSLVHLPAVGGIVLNARDITEGHQARERIAREAARTQALLRTSGRLNAQIDLDTVLKTVCEEAAQALGASAATINLYDAERQTYYLAAGIGLPLAYTQRHRPIPAAALKQFGSLLDQPIMVVADVQALDGMPNAALYRDFDIRTIAAAHMARDAASSGYLQVITTGGIRHYSDDELALLRGLADQAANAITNARLYDQARLRLERLHALHTIDRVIISQQRLADSLGAVVEQVAQQLRVDAAAVMLYNSDRAVLEFVAGVGFRRDTVRHISVPFGVGHAGRAAREQSIQFHTIPGDEDASLRAALWQDEGFVCHFSAPLVTQEQLLGVLEIFHRAALEPNAEWLAYLEALAVQVAIAVDRDTLLTRTQEQARQLAVIHRAVPGGIALLDASARIVEVNPEGQRCLLILTGADVGDVITTVGGAPVASFLTALSPPRQPREIVLPDGDTAFELAAEPLQDDGAIQGWVLLVREVTEARRRRQQMAQQERLAAVGQLAAGIAHDFNNILTPIRLYVDLSLDAAQPNSLLRANLDQIGAAADRARDLVAQILAFSRRETQTKPAPTQMQEVVKEALQLVRAGLPSRIEIHSSIQESAGLVLAIPSQIHQIVMNLCTNAFHAMREHGGVLTVVLENVTLTTDLMTTSGVLPPGAYVGLSVRDTGHGMDTATLNRVFEPFYTTKSPGEGTGLGLSVVFGIVAESGGGLHVETAPGQGAVFTVYLPRVEAPSALPPPLYLTGTRGAARILVVDDEPQITSAMRGLLEHLEYAVDTAANGPEALTRLAHSTARFDLVLTDLTMPGLSGLELAQAIQMLPTAPPVILMTGYHEAVEPQTYQAIGIRDVLMKPFSAQTVDRVIRMALVPGAERREGA